MEEMPRAWLEPQAVLVPADLAAAVGGHPLVAETLVRRGIATPAAARAFLDPGAYTLAPPEALPGLAVAVERLEAAIRAAEPICVWGDFDVDGQTATTLLVSALADLGAQVTYHIPVRATEGHGVGVPVLRTVIAAGARVILTCDTGIAAVEAAAFARSQGVDLIVTDHHDPPAVLPDAYAIVNPKIVSPDAIWRDAALPSAPLRSLPGVGVAYQLAQALYRRAGRAEAAAGLLDLVALGIVADLAELTGDVRPLLQRGLAALRQTQRLGLHILMETVGLDPVRLTEEHISFVIAPRLNALGRLADANAAVEFLLLMRSAQETDGSDSRLLTRAHILAADLEALNARRKLLCDQVEAAAEAQIARDPTLLEGGALVLAGPGWHPGVIGIVASRFVARYGKPTVLLSLPPPGAAEPARGSARSVVGVNITAAIAAHADLLLGFGGHPMAAGLSLPVERVAEFRRALARTAAQLAAAAHVSAGLPIDGVLSLSDLTPELVADLERLAPFGPGNLPLTLVGRNLQVRGTRPLGRDQAHLLVIVEDAWGATHEVIWWDGGQETPPAGPFDLAYTVRSSDYRGAAGLQIAWVAARPLEPADGAIQAQAEVAVVDYRTAADLHTALRRLPTDRRLLIWSEGPAEAQPAGLAAQHNAGGAPQLVGRHQLTAAPCLAIWTAPPGPAELAAALAVVRPEVVYLFGRDPGLDAPAAFLGRLSGLVKHVLRRGGPMQLVQLATALAARETTVRQGLAWLAARGHIRLAQHEDDVLTLEPGDGIVRPDLAGVAARLEALLAETAAYRAYFAVADKARLIR